MEPLSLVFFLCIAPDADTIRCRHTAQTKATIQRIAPARLKRRWSGQFPSSLSIRIWGIDAPERGRPGFNAGKQAMNALIRRKKVICSIPPNRRRYDWSYRRIVALCRLADGTDIAKRMLKAGHAKACRQYSGTYYDPNAKRC